MYSNPTESKHNHAVRRGPNQFTAAEEVAEKEDVPGIIVRCMYSWAVKRIAKYRLPSPPADLPPISTKVDPAAVRLVTKAYGDNPRIMALFRSKKYVKECFKVALRFVRLMATRSTSLANYEEVLVIFERLARDELDSFNFAAIFVYIGIALATDEHLVRKGKHELGISDANSRSNAFSSVRRINTLYLLLKFQNNTK
ncbi:hypothetical protein TYRP_007039 [Tyrophagus putrescentiae]|nr:hypothetical protein TYRP_007039 [Tyrophagus putrescentiae]